ncbi:hypothetical protein GLV94_19525 [Virgibacillus halodenitrificans]|uniref:hypothetical protein n=1 Tax=Virgibacillus halodenitrificans TaxID=1482 RepID=UPI001370627B|nr:hypothetical protein [Virgibacillus halodenitrificans]MYL47831.1 hypothetical protein [Virgibacillus halodenitrificans]
MDPAKFLLYMNILGICLPIALTYVVFACIITHQPVQPLAIIGLAFGYVIMIKRNVVFHELWNKWFNKKN